MGFSNSKSARQNKNKNPKLYYHLLFSAYDLFFKPKIFNFVSKFVSDGLQSFSKIKSLSEEVRRGECN